MAPAEGLAGDVAPGRPGGVLLVMCFSHPGLPWPGPLLVCTLPPLGDGYQWNGTGMVHVCGRVGARPRPVGGLRKRGLRLGVPGPLIAHTLAPVFLVGVRGGCRGSAPPNAPLQGAFLQGPGSPSVHAHSGSRDLEIPFLSLSELGGHASYTLLCRYSSDAAMVHGGGPVLLIVPHGGMVCPVGCILG